MTARATSDPAGADMFVVAPSGPWLPGCKWIVPQVALALGHDNLRVHRDDGLDLRPSHSNYKARFRHGIVV